MTLNLEKEAETDFTFDENTLARDVICAAIDYESFPYEAEINLTITDNPGICEINRLYRNIDSPTDVLSFPMLSFDKAGDFSQLEDDYEDNFNPDTGEILLGDIILSAERIKEQALAYGHSEKREFAFLIVHSMLHLFGYDHMTKEEADMMEEKQNEILNQMHIFRE